MKSRSLEIVVQELMIQLAFRGVLSTEDLKQIEDRISKKIKAGVSSSELGKGS